jgi:stearoyl-CoA desaturase (Delta-9 desaturase)
MSYYWLCFAIFALAYGLNMTFISVFYHRGLTHEAIRLQPALRRFVIASGTWITGIDIKSWVCMHRTHHTYSDTQKDPHSPKRWGLFGTVKGQLLSYKKTLRELKRNNPEYTSMVSDLEFDISFLNRKKIWLLPYVIHFTVWMVRGVTIDACCSGYAYFLGMMSHPVQGWLVNAVGHAVGYRNFNVSDDSRHNTAVALLCFGEGFQNNHHRFPKSAKFSIRWFEFDMGYVVTRFLARLGLVEILSIAKISDHTSGVLTHESAAATN